MDTVIDRLHMGLNALSTGEKDWNRREDNYRGDQQLPYAPEGVSVEYQELRDQSIANWLRPAMDVPVQRMEVESVTDADGEIDKDAWATMEAAQMQTRGRILFSQMMVHGRGVMSVSKSPSGPRMMIENCRRVHIEGRADDPFTRAWAVKSWTEKRPRTSSLILPADADLGGLEVAVVYDETKCTRFEKKSSGMYGKWEDVGTVDHGLKSVPFVSFGSRLDADAVPHSAIDDLIPMQNAINTIRFNTLLAMQFSAYRQRVVVGYDPILRNDSGDIVYITDENGEPIVGPGGEPVPALRPGGRAGVDRLLVFPGSETKVFDLAESNLKNYVEVYIRFLTDLFTMAQIPPQYALDKMANLSGDAMAGADATLQSLVSDLQAEASGGFNEVLQLMDIAAGRSPQSRRLAWADRAPKSFGQIVDGIVKLISQGFPKRDAWDMLPGATPVKVQAWIDHALEESRSEIDQLTATSSMSALEPAPQE
ncbi:phage portal protein [Gordonia malaquae]|uniref:phage portal protein n=1 Tax=Gordonia malaquae TaxID=410332 RepID=UPI00301A5B32